MKTPSFWYKNTSFLTYFLLPFSYLYRLGSHLRRALTKACKPPCPVLCVGNLTLGGSGKTPVVHTLRTLLQKGGSCVHVVSRGYGGQKHIKPVLVDPQKHTSFDVGDEPLLLSQGGPTWVCTHKKKAISEAYKNGAKIILMDDGFQNPTIQKHKNILVIGSLKSLGNQKVFPAGPLREPLKSGIKRADCILTFDSEQSLRSALILPKTIPVFSLTRTLSFSSSLTGGNVLAFCGLGFPKQFYDALEKNGKKPIETISFPDHHPYTSDDIKQLESWAYKKNGTLVCTEKDWIKLPPTFQKKVVVVHQTLTLPATFIDWYKKHIK